MKFWRRKRKAEPQSREVQPRPGWIPGQRITDQDRIGPGDPGWEMFQRAMETGEAVIAVYDSRTGEMISIDGEEPRGGPGGS